MHAPEDDVWEMELPFQTGHHYVQFKLDGAEVLTPLLPISYGYSRPYNYVELRYPDTDRRERRHRRRKTCGKRTDAQQHGTVRREQWREF